MFSRTPIKPARSIGKKLPKGNSSFPLTGPPSGNSVFISELQLGRGRPAKHLFGLNRARQSPARAEPHLAFQPRDQTPRDGPETYGSQPSGYPFKLKAAPASPTLAGRTCKSSFLRTCHWGGCSKITGRLCHGAVARDPLQGISSSPLQRRIGLCRDAT
jgi:hypothetical protein